MSLVVPTITADGSLVYPVKKGDKWHFAGQEVNLSFASCDPAKDFEDGAMISGSLIVLCAVAYGFRILNDFIKRMMIEKYHESETI
ncbi:hypothetical protein [Alysiella filiformis]|nr:hypothetical protein [Alysiella filiformis]QMT31392.1 hypothetical protein H3L97_00280 [Alysiella filiformis]UBQ55598.1 hypothetical protein JF568_08390 [Alysiella filiformis DSM 16848]